MTVLSLVLAAPLQAWGSESRFTTRASDDAPTKSGVLGLLAAAKGLRRTDPLEELTHLRFGVRLDQPGKHLRDFQTARSLDGRKTMPLSQRYYLADGRYAVGLEADRELLEGVAEALLNPVYPLYLGRRSCPPSQPLVPRLHESSLEGFLLTEPWHAATWWKRRRSSVTGGLRFRIDAEGTTGELDPYLTGESTRRDVPVSFDPEHRQYGWRTVQHGIIPVPLERRDDEQTDGPDTDTALTHEPMAALE